MRKNEILSSKIVLSNEYKILSRRELEVLILAAAGYENNQIADIFHVTLSTIKKQLESTYEKLKAKNRANAVFIAQYLNLISIEDFNVVLNSLKIG